MQEYYYCRACGATTTDPHSHGMDCERAQKTVRGNPRLDPSSMCKPIPTTDGVHVAGGGCVKCYGGLKGRNRCSQCGNTKEPPLDEWGIRMFFRPPDIGARDFSRGLSQEWCRFKPGKRYRIKFTGETDDDPYHEMTCLITSGPYATMHDGTSLRGKDIGPGDVKSWCPIQDDVHPLQAALDRLSAVLKP